MSLEECGAKHYIIRWIPLLFYQKRTGKQILVSCTVVEEFFDFCSCFSNLWIQQSRPNTLTNIGNIAGAKADNAGEAKSLYHHIR